MTHQFLGKLFWIRHDLCCLRHRETLFPLASEVIQNRFNFQFCIRIFWTKYKLQSLKFVLYRHIFFTTIKERKRIISAYLCFYKNILTVFDSYLCANLCPSEKWKRPDTWNIYSSIIALVCYSATVYLVRLTFCVCILILLILNSVMRS